MAYIGLTNVRKNVRKYEKSVTFQIGRQVGIPRGKHFKKGSIRRYAGIKIQSIDCPDWRPKEKELFVKGVWLELDDEPITVSTDEFKMIRKALKAFNDSHKRKSAARR